MHAFIKMGSIHLAKHTHPHEEKHACTHSTNEDKNLTVSLLSAKSVSLPVAARKSLKFCLLSCLSVGQRQAIKRKVTSHYRFSPSVLPFRTLQHFSFVWGASNWTLTCESVWIIYRVYREWWCRRNCGSPVSFKGEYTQKTKSYTYVHTYVWWCEAMLRV